MLVRNVTMEEADQLYPLICLSVRPRAIPNVFDASLGKADKTNFAWL